MPSSELPQQRAVALRARLQHAQGNLDQAREHLSKAKSIIEETGYHRPTPRRRRWKRICWGRDRRGSRGTPIFKAFARRHRTEAGARQAGQRLGCLGSASPGCLGCKLLILLCDSVASVDSLAYALCLTSSRHFPDAATAAGNWPRLRVESPAMANPEHLAILKQGVEVWNQWREEKREPRPDLSRADLSGRKLSGVNFRNAELHGADLGLANLYSADLRRASLIKADLGGATLSESDLRGAILLRSDLRVTILRRAKLRRTNLHGASFIGTDLEGADLGTASMNSTSIGDIDLSVVDGLNDVQHHGRSTIGTDTLLRTALGIAKAPTRLGEIEAFLRGAGVPENFVDFFRSQIGQPMFDSCFISYNSTDQEFSERLYTDLKENGVDCFFAPQDMKIGDKILDRIDQTIRDHDKLLVVLSAASISSEWVEDEVTLAFEEEHKRKTTVLFPIRLDDAVMDSSEPWAAKVRQRHIGDFTDWNDHVSYKKAFEGLLMDLQVKVRSS